VTLKLDKGLENALTVAIADELGRATVDHARFVSLRRDHELSSDDLLSPEASEKVYRYYGDGGLRGFVVSEVNSKLRSKYDFIAESKDKNLRDFEPFTNPLTAAKIIVGRLKALPYRYRLTVQLPVEKSEPLMTFVAAVKLSETAVICAANRLPENFETSSKDSRIDGDLFQTFLAKV